MFFSEFFSSVRTGTVHSLLPSCDTGVANVPKEVASHSSYYNHPDPLEHRCKYENPDLATEQIKYLEGQQIKEELEEQVVVPAPLCYVTPRVCAVEGLGTTKKHLEPDVVKERIIAQILTVKGNHKTQLGDFTNEGLKPSADTNFQRTNGITSMLCTDK